jgi:hypothetical protein
VNVTNHERAKVWLDAHMKYMPSDLTDLRILLDQVYADGFNAGAAEQACLAQQEIDQLKLAR